METRSNVQSYPAISASESEIPQSIMSNSFPRPIQSRIAYKQVLSQTSTQSSNGSLVFPIPCGMGMGFLRSGSVYLNCTIAVTKADATIYSFNHSKCADAIILRATTYVNGSILEQHQNYNRTQAFMQQHCSNASYLANDLAVLAGANQAITTPASINVSVPLIGLGSINSLQDIPLFLCNTFQVELNLDTVASAFIARSGVMPTEYSVSNSRLIYECFIPEADYEMSMRQVLASGKLFQMPMNSWYNLVVSNASGATKNQTIGLNMSSVLGVFHFTELGASAVAGVIGELLNGSDAQTNSRLFVDGNLLFPYPLGDTSVIFAEKSRALNVLVDAERSSSRAIVVGVPADLSTGTFLTNNFLCGYSLLRTQEAGFVMPGTPVGQLQLEVTNAGGAGNMFIHVAYQQIVTLDALGNLQLIR